MSSAPASRATPRSVTASVQTPDRHPSPSSSSAVFRLPTTLSSLTAPLRDLLYPPCSDSTPVAPEPRAPRQHPSPTDATPSTAGGASQQTPADAAASMASVPWPATSSDPSQQVAGKRGAGGTPTPAAASPGCPPLESDSPSPHPSRLPSPQSPPPLPQQHHHHQQLPRHDQQQRDGQRQQRQQQRQRQPQQQQQQRQQQHVDGGSGLLAAAGQCDEASGGVDSRQWWPQSAQTTGPAAEAHAPAHRSGPLTVDRTYGGWQSFRFDKQAILSCFE
ncbi:MAG: hypothetical protein WDW36_006353 [Sanguina aurantia]